MYGIYLHIGRSSWVGIVRVYYYLQSKKCAIGKKASVVVYIYLPPKMYGNTLYKIAVPIDSGSKTFVEQPECILS